MTTATTPSAPSERTTVCRIPPRGDYDPASIRAILDQGLVCHVGFVVDGQPFVIPTAYARAGDVLYLHGSPASRMLRNLAAGVSICATVTHLDGLVVARSAFHHSMNYRSVVVVGRARRVDGAEERIRALRAVVEHIVPGRWDESRRPSARELAQTLVLALPLDEASAKLRTGPPVDDDADHALDHWAGVVPLALVPGEPQPDPRLRDGIAAPASVTRYQRPGAAPPG